MRGYAKTLISVDLAASQSTAQDRTYCLRSGLKEETMASDTPRLIEVLRPMSREERATFLLKYALCFGRTHKRYIDDAGRVKFIKPKRVHAGTAG